jgi:hypothetical protein
LALWLANVSVLTTSYFFFGLFLSIAYYKTTTRP